MIKLKQALNEDIFLKNDVNIKKYVHTKIQNIQKRLSKIPNIEIIMGESSEVSTDDDNLWGKPIKMYSEDLTVSTLNENDDYKYVAVSFRYSQGAAQGIDFYPRETIKIYVVQIGDNWKIPPELKKKFQFDNVFEYKSFQENSLVKDVIKIIEFNR